MSIYIYIGIVLGLITLLVFNIRYTILKIKYKRQKGNDIRNKNVYYKCVSNVFLKDLPK